MSTVKRKQSGQSAAEVQRLLDEGRGRGHFENYLSWHLAEETPNLGHSSTFFAPWAKRDMHSLSEIEEGLLYAYGRVKRGPTQSRENYRLSMSLTERICTIANRRHSKSTGPGKPLIPFTTDLLLSLDRPPWHIAISCKRRSDLREAGDAYRSMFVELVYWSLHDVPFFAVTELEMPKIITTSLRFIAPRQESGQQPTPEQRARFLAFAQQADWSPELVSVVRQVSEQAGIDSTVGMLIFRSLAWDGDLECDFTRQLSPSTRNAVTRRAQP